MPRYVTIRRGRALKAHESINREREELPERVFWTAGAAFRPVVFQADLPKANERTQAAHEPHTLRQSLHGVDDATIHEAEIAGVERNVDVGNRTQQAIEDAIRDCLERVPCAAPAHREDDVASLAPQTDEIGDDLRWILQVAVHDDDGSTLRVINARGDRGLMSEIARENERLEPRVACGQRVQQCAELRRASHRRRG